MDERLKAFSRKAAETAAQDGRDSPPVAQRHIDRFDDLKQALLLERPIIKLSDGWCVMIQCGGRLPEEVSASCTLMSPIGNGHWREDGILTTDACRDVALKLSVVAREEGFTPPSDIEIVSSIPDDCVERGIESFRQPWAQ